MDQVISILSQEIARLKIVEEKYLELISKQEPVQVIEIKIKNPKRVAAGKASAEKVKAKKEAIKQIQNEFLENAQFEWETASENSN